MTWKAVFDPKNFQVTQLKKRENKNLFLASDSHGLHAENWKENDFLY